MKRKTTPPVFDAYAAYYDLLYRDKDYAGEADYVQGLLRKFRPGAGRILEFGSGTGRHARLLAERGYAVRGVERSEVMLAAAKKARPRGGAAPVSFSRGDIRSCRVAGTFDAVISLFHVISYLPDNRDLRATLDNARRHLAPGGVFVFDFWYGPAVLTERPAVRVKRMEDDRCSVTRVATPSLDTEACTVDVHYEMLIVEKQSEKLTRVDETHRMRFLFLPEIAQFLETAGFQLEHAEEWMSGRKPSAATWGVCVVARAGGGGR